MAIQHVEDDLVNDVYGLRRGDQYQYRMVEPFGVWDDGVELIGGAG